MWWHKLEFSSETIDNLKIELQKLQEEAKKLLRESTLFELEENAQEDARLEARTMWLLEGGRKR